MKKDRLLKHFGQLYEIIPRSRTKALQTVNFEQLNLFWQVGAFIDQKISNGSWGDKVVDEFAMWLKEKDPSVKNFDRRNIYRMRVFFLAWHNVSWTLDASGLSIVGSLKPQLLIPDNKSDQIVVSLKPQLPDMPSWLGVIPWTHHLTILSEIITDRRKNLFFKTILFNL